MFESLLMFVAHLLMWTFAVGMIGCLLIVIPITAYRLFSVLFEKDSPEESTPARPHVII
jgi:hypothetical protein